MPPLAGMEVVEVAQDLSDPYAAGSLATLRVGMMKVGRPGGKRWLSGPAQKDTAALPGWTDAQWDAVRPSR